MSRRRADRLLVATLWASGAIAGLLLAAIVLFTVAEALPVVSAVGVLPFLTDASWHPLSGKFGMMPMIAATVVASILAVLVATPVGLALAIVEQFYLGPRAAAMLRRTVEVLSGLPSVVVGLWGLAVLVPLLAQWQPPGTSLIAATIVLALMLVPTIALFASIAFERVDQNLRRAAAAIALGRSALVLEVSMPLAARGIAAGVVLALARAVGETMMVLMVAGNVPGWPTHLFAPVRTLTANMALEMAYADGLHRSALFLSGVFVMIVALVLVTLASRISEVRDDAR